MKKILYLIIILSLAIVSCQDNDKNIQTEQSGELYFTVDVPEAIEKSTKAAIEAGMIESLYLMVFDENGLFLSRHKAELVTNYGGYKVLLPESDTKRIIHFVCNNNWTGFSAVNSLGKSENELINSFSVTAGKIAYWQRLELPTGVAAGVLNQTIFLLRNVAKVSVVNLSTGVKYLTDITFGMGDCFDKGSMAPFNTTSMVFAEGAVTEVSTAGYVAANESNFVHSGTSLTAKGSPFYTYERKNSTASRPSYVIIKGYFQDGGALNTTVPSYYKVDIVDNGVKVLYDIERNYHYILKINSVTMKGYATFNEAVNSPASNNIESSVLVQKFTSVTDGVSQLNVDYTSKLFVRSGRNFTINFSFIPNSVNGIVNNTGVLVTLEQDNAKPVVASGTFSFVASGTTGTISGTTAALPGFTEVYTATFTVTKGSLKRVITLRLRQPLDFTNVYTNPNPVANQAGEPVDLHFTIPTAIDASEFPFPVYIYTKKLSPNITDKLNNNLILDVEGNNYRYVYYVDQPGEQVLYFKTNSTNSTELIKLEADLLNDANYQQQTVNRTPLTSLSFTPNGTALAAMKNQPVKMSFTIPVVAGVNPPYSVRIQTSKLNFVSSPNGTAIPTDYGYLYTTNSTGVKTIDFVTNAGQSGEYVIVGEDRFASLSYQRSCAPFVFTTATLSPKPRNTSNTSTTITLTINVPDDSLPVTVKIDSKDVLIDVPSGQAGLVRVEDITSITGYYLYTITTPGTKTVTFRNRVTTTSVRNRAMYLSAPYFTTSGNLN